MKIIVAIKQVPERDAQLVVSPDGRWIDEDGLNYVINEPDAYALEEALQLKEQHGGEVIALCAGPERVTSTLREALAKGADDQSKQLRDSERGRLAVVRYKETKASATDPSPTIAITVFNLGRTGVVIKWIYFDIDAGPSPFNPEPTYPLPQKRARALNAVAANAEYSAGLSGTINPPLTQEDYDALNAGTRIVLVWGYIEFEDAFGDTYVQRFGARGKLDGLWYVVDPPAYNAEIKQQKAAQ